jgi:hypothetical protein
MTQDIDIIITLIYWTSYAALDNDAENLHWGVLSLYSDNLNVRATVRELCHYKVNNLNVGSTTEELYLYIDNIS